jgi:hypothetical protein
MVDISKYVKVRKEWIFDDTFQESVIVIFEQWIPDYKANSGKEYDVIELDILGKPYLIMPSKLDYTELVEKLGTETEAWKNTQCVMKKEKGKYRLYMMEETIN